MITKRMKYVGLGFLASFFICGGVLAATQSVTANMAFDTVLGLSKTNDINFGTVKALQSGTYVISTSGTVSPSGGGVVVGGTPAAGVISITGSTTQTIAISTGSYNANNGVTPSVATCSYNGSPIADCDVGGTGLTAPGAGKNLLLGVTAVVDGTQGAGTTAAPTFTVTVIYG